MTAKQAIFPNSRQVAFLTGLADEAIAAEDRAAAILSAQEAKKEEDTRKRLALGNKIIRRRADRLKAVGRAESAAKAFTKAVAEIIKAAGQERDAMTELSGPHADTLADVSILRRLSKYLSHELRQLSGPTGTKFGEIQLCNYFRASLSWEDAERRTAAALPGHDGNGGDGG